MKYPVVIYAKALAEAAASGAAEAVVRKNFLELLRRSGDEAHLPKILAEAERLMRQKDGTKRIVVHLARKQEQPARELVRGLADPGDLVEEEIDPSLIAGMKVVVDDEREFDASLRTKLERMFTT